MRSITCTFLFPIFITTTSTALVMKSSETPTRLLRNGASLEPVSSSGTSFSVAKVLSRRRVVTSSFLAISASFAATASASPARAVDDLFKPNPLTNKLLEQVRILDQTAADNIRYGGELAPGKMRDSYARLLVPILTIERGLLAVNELIRVPDGGGLSKAMKILDQPEYQKKEFKKTFNAFADNIYYEDPDRANAYLVGGATPKNEQSIAYLLRNDILTNVEALQAEVSYLLKEKAKIDDGKEEGPLDTDDLLEYGKTCVDGMAKYLALVPPNELEMARSYVEQG